MERKFILKMMGVAFCAVFCTDLSAAPKAYKTGLRVNPWDVLANNPGGIKTYVDEGVDTAAGVQKVYMDAGAGYYYYSDVNSSGYADAPNGGSFKAVDSTTPVTPDATGNTTITETVGNVAVATKKNSDGLVVETTYTYGDGSTKKVENTATGATTTITRGGATTTVVVVRGGPTTATYSVDGVTIRAIVETGGKIVLTGTSNEAKSQALLGVISAGVSSEVAANVDGTFTVGGNTYTEAQVVDSIKSALDVATSNASATSSVATATTATVANVVSSSPGQFRGFSTSQKSLVRNAMRSGSMNERMPNVLNALAESGPMVIDVEKIRFWMSPFASVANYGGAQAREKGFGVLMGVTYKADRYAVGFFAGYNTSKNEHNQLNKSSKTDSMSFGLNGSVNLWKDGAVNLIYSYAPSTVTHKQNLGALTGAQEGKQKNDAHIINASVTHGFKFANAYSLKLELGNTSVLSKQGTYFGNNSEIKGQSQEAYAGFGLGWSKMVEAGQINVNTSYKFGTQYKNSNKSPNTKIIGSLYIPGVLAEKRKTHYVGLSTGMLLNKSWRIDLGYNGAYAKKDQNHAVVARIEYRM